MDRCALFVDASYVLADGAMAVHGTRRRESVSWDYPGLLALLGNLAMERANLPLLRCYWYEATVEGRRSADHDTLADLPGVKLRVAKMRPGRREGVEGEIHRDLTTLARNKAVSDAMVVSAEEDLAQVIADVQDMGMRVTLLQIVGDGTGAVSRALRQECDDIVEVSAAHLRPYVELISGAEPARSDESDGTLVALRPALNGNGNGHAPALGQHTFPQSQSQSQSQQQQPVPGPGQAAAPPPAPAAAEYQPPAEQQQPAPAEAVQAGPAQAGAGPAEHADSAAPADYSSMMPDFNASVDYHSSVDFGSIDYGSAPDYGHSARYASFPDRAAAPVPPLPPAPPAQPPGMREDLYAAPVALPAPAEYQPAEREQQPPGLPQHGMEPGMYAPGAAREQYQRDGMLREQGGVPDGDDRQPVPVSLPVGSAQVRRLPTRGAVTAGPNAVQVPAGLAPVRTPGGEDRPGQAQLPPAQPPALPQFTAEPTAAQPLPGGFAGGQPVAPVLPMDANGAGYAAQGGPRPVMPGAPGTPVGLSGNGGAGQQGGGAPVPHPPLGPAGTGQQAPAMTPPSPVHGGPGMGAPSGPIGLVGPGGYPGGAPSGPSLADAVQSAHEEGQAFGESVARDAPALWLEAVLARKPRMPSDLEARLLQGSALPIDFLLHDEVRHALRRGFWDALERSRR